MQLLMAQVGLSGLAGDWRAVVRVYCKLVLLAEHWRLLGAIPENENPCRKKLDSKGWVLPEVSHENVNADSL